MDQDVLSKLTSYNRAMCVINTIFKPSSVQKHTRIEVYKIARLILVFGYEVWTIWERNKKRLTANETNSRFYKNG
jgi:hypothetical protein